MAVLAAVVMAELLALLMAYLSAEKMVVLKD